MITKIENIPKELRKLNCWVCWDNSKLPKNPATGGNAQSNNPSTWGTFKQAVKACETFGFMGIGFMFDGKSGYFGVDLDHCLDKTDFCEEFVETLQSYAEISKSGTGLHIICKGKLPQGSRRKDSVEMYSVGRYFICTGNIYNPNYTEIKDCTETIKVLHNKYLPSTTPKVEVRKQSTVTLEDQEVIDKANLSKNGVYFNLLYSGQWQGGYPSQSEADMALCAYLAFWTGRNEAQMDRIFRSSGLMRAKWDEKRGENTYGQKTVLKACADCTDVYDPEIHTEIKDIALKVFKNGKKGATSAEEKIKKYDMTDTGNAHRLYDKCVNRIKYSYNRRKWYFWNGQKWVLDELGQIKRLADEICEDLKYEAALIEDEETAKAAVKFARATANTTRKNAMITECQHLGDIPAAPDDFDKHLDLLNCANGIVNLKNGELIPHQESYMLSKMTGCEYDVNHNKPEKWLSFLDDITDGNVELIEYIQRCIGYSLSGSIQEQCAYFLYGDGNNGKSTFLDVLANIIGDYSQSSQPDTFLIQSRLGSAGGGANSEIARLKGARFVYCEEPQEGIRLNEGLLKQLTGGSRIVARFLYSEEFEYMPEFKIWMATNHKPVVRGTDVGIWRRIKLIPFEVMIPAEKVDINLKYKLRAEFPQILAWAVEGCIKWQQDGLKEPNCVKIATKSYENEMDLLAPFLEQCIIIDHSSTNVMRANDLFTLYSQWAKTNNEYVLSSKKFGAEISKKLPEKKRMSIGNVYPEIRLTEYAQNLTGKNYKADDFK